MDANTFDTLEKFINVGKKLYGAKNYKIFKGEVDKDNFIMTIEIYNLKTSLQILDLLGSCEIKFGIAVDDFAGTKVNTDNYIAIIIDDFRDSAIDEMKEYLKVVVPGSLPFY